MKFLHLEDNVADAELVRLLLAREWPDCVVRWVAEPESFTTALQTEAFDLILSDFSLVRFDGLAALKLARRIAPDTPFVFLSGNIGEDRAIEALREGAQDYVLKDRMKRLASTLERALRESDERRRLRASEAERTRLSAILESTPDFVGMIDPAGRVLYLNQAARRMLGLDATASPSAITLRELHPPEIAARQLDEIFPLAARTGAWTGETLLLRNAAPPLAVSQVVMPHLAADGSVAHYSTVLRDLTAQKRSEALVLGQKQILERIAAGESLAATLDALLRFLEEQAPDTLGSILLLTDDGQHLHHCAAPSLPSAYRAAVDGGAIGPRAGSCGTAAYRRARVLVDDVSTDPLWSDYRDLALAHGLASSWSTPIFDTHQHLLGTLALYRRHPGPPSPRHLQLMDTGTHLAAICLSRHLAEHRLRSQANLLNKARDAIIVLDPAACITFWNQGAERIFGWTSAEVLGRPDRDFLGERALAEIAAARRSLEQDNEWHGDVHVHDKARRPLVIEARVTSLADDLGRPQGRLIIATDISAKRQIEEQFYRAQRLESLGMLAAGIAHDLNNVLAPILLAAPMLRDSIAHPEDLHLIEALEHSAERGAGLVRQILSFARGAESEQRLIQPKHLLRDLLDFMTQTFPKSIALVEEIPGDLWTIQANPTQLHQVVLNLCVNARDAMPAGGTLSLTAANCFLDEAAALALPGSRVGAYVLIRVADSGTGIPPEVLPHIWQPFYTTKEPGKGTGLGLSTVRGIVENHGGFIAVDTQPGLGTTFRIYLGAAEPDPTHPAFSAPDARPPRGKGELVLVVDDEVNIRDMTAVMLSHHGYRVLTASDGTAAVALFASRAYEIDLLVTDLSMPNLDGSALSHVIHQLKPKTKILIVSGLSETSSEVIPPPNLPHEFLLKPFKADVLLAAVHRLLHPPAIDPPPSPT